MHELRRELRKVGRPMTEGRIRYAELRGYIDKPSRDALENRVYDVRHVEQLIRLFDNPPRKGRKPQPTIA